MQRFKRLLLQLAAWPRTSSRRTAQAIRVIRASGYLVPVTWNNIWWVHEPDRPSQLTEIPRRSTQIDLSAPTVIEKIRKTLSEFVLWCGLLFSAALVGTFIVLGMVILYALVMSLLGH